MAVVTGDDVLRRSSRGELALETGAPIAKYGELVSANAYLGAEALLPALQSGADIIITGRVADPSLFVAPIAHEYGWQLDDFDRLARGTSIGHLLECAGQLCGGYFAEPGRKDVPDMAHLGFPYADVDADGNATLGKVDRHRRLHHPGDGEGAVALRGDRSVRLRDAGRRRRLFHGDDCARPGRTRSRSAVRRGKQAPAKLKVSVGYLAGYVGEGEISYGGANALARARLAGEIIRQRLGREFPDTAHRSDRQHVAARQVVRRRRAALRNPPARRRARADARSAHRWSARKSKRCTPTGRPAAAARASTCSEQIGIVSTLIERERVSTQGDVERVVARCRKLHDLAHCRAGDKGNTSILSLIAYRAEDYPLLAERVTVDAVRKHLQGIVLGEVRRYELPGLWALQFVCDRSLERRRHDVARRSMRTASR